MSALRPFAEWLAALFAGPVLNPEDTRCARDACPDCFGTGMVEALGPTACSSCVDEQSAVVTRKDLDSR